MHCYHATAEHLEELHCQNIFWKNNASRRSFFGKITRLAGIFPNIFGLRVKLLQNKFKISVMGNYNYTYIVPVDFHQTAWRKLTVA